MFSKRMVTCSSKENRVIHNSQRCIMLGGRNMLRSSTLADDDPNLAVIAG
jgi:hypothetical protein